MKKAAFFVMMLVLFGFINIGLAQETLTITTYYPAPYGVYRELRTQRMAVGDTYYGSDYCWPPASCTTAINANADLVVEGDVSIGTVANPNGYSLFIKSPDSYNLMLETTDSAPTLRIERKSTSPSAYWDNWAIQNGVRNTAGGVVGELEFIETDAWGETRPFKIEHKTSSDTLYLDYGDATGGWVGIGTSTPEGKLHVRKKGTLDLYFENASDMPSYRTDLNIRRARGTIPGLTNVQNNDNIGGLVFLGYSSGYRKAAEISANVSGAVSGTSVPGDIAFRTTPVGGSGTEERMRIENDGDIKVSPDIASPVLIKRFENIGNDANISTGISSDDYYCVATGWSAAYDIHEDEPTINMVWTYTSGGVWRLRAVFGSEGGNDENPDVDVLCFRKEICEWQGAATSLNAPN